MLEKLEKKQSETNETGWTMVLPTKALVGEADGLHHNRDYNVAAQQLRLTVPAHFAIPASAAFALSSRSSSESELVQWLDPDDKAEGARKPRQLVNQADVDEVIANGGQAKLMPRASGRRRRGDRERRRRS